MSVYLSGSNAIVDAFGFVATSTACCCDVGTCCIGESCSIETPSDCEDMGGVFFGGSTCDPNPCETGACCAHAICTIQNASTCAGLGGTFFPGITCSPDPCICPATPTITVTFTDLASCGCGSFGGFLGSGSAKLLSGDVAALNGVYTLPVVTHPTYTFVSASPVITLFLYTDGSCTIPFSTPSIGLYLKIFFQCNTSGGNSTLAAVLSTLPGSGGQTVFIFNSNIHFGPSLPPITYINGDSCGFGNLAEGIAAIAHW